MPARRAPGRTWRIRTPPTQTRSPDLRAPPPPPAAAPPAVPDPASVVIEPGDTDLKLHQLLTEELYRKAREDYGPTKFRAQMGAEAIKELLKRVDILHLADDLRVAGHQATALAPLGPVDKQALLCAPTPGRRVEMLRGMLADQIEVLQARLAAG